MAKQDTQTPASDDLTLSSRTMKALGLNQQPFSTAILSDKTTYTDSILNKQYEKIKHHLQFSDLIQIVEGVLGSGKTTLFRRLFQLDIASLYLMPIQAEATDTLIQIQQKMTIHMQDQGNANYLDDNLKNLQVFDQTPVLIIDDTHVLSDTTLQELLRYKQQLAAEKDTHLKLLLLANKGMAKTLEQISDLEHDQFYVQEMPKYTSKQILAFIAHRLKLAGADTLPQLDESSIKKLTQKTDGIPAAVMSAAVKLINSQSGKKPGLAFKMSSRPVLLGSALVLVLAIAGWQLYPIFSPQMAELSSALPLNNSPEVAPVKPLFVESSAAIESSDNETDTDETTENDEIGLPEAIKISDTIDFNDTKDEVIVEPIAQITPEPAIAEIPPQQADTSTVEPEVVKEEEKPRPNRLALAKAVAPEPVVPAPVSAQAPAETPKAGSFNDPALRTLTTMGIKDQNWLLQQNKNQWTLQVLGAHDPQTLVKFAQTHRLGSDTAWYQTSLNGADWYVMVHRFYTDRDIARNSIGRLPASLRQARPWVRSIDSIHKAVN